LAQKQLRVWFTGFDWSHRSDAGPAAGFKALLKQFGQRWSRSKYGSRFGVPRFCLSEKQGNHSFQQSQRRCFQVFRLCGSDCLLRDVDCPLSESFPAKGKAGDKIVRIKRKKRRNRKRSDKGEIYKIEECFDLEKLIGHRQT